MNFCSLPWRSDPLKAKRWEKRAEREYSQEVRKWINRKQNANIRPAFRPETQQQVNLAIWKRNSSHYIISYT